MKGKNDKNQFREGQLQDRRQDQNTATQRQIKKTRHKNDKAVDKHREKRQQDEAELLYCLIVCALCSHFSSFQTEQASGMCSVWNERKVELKADKIKQYRRKHYAAQKSRLCRWQGFMQDKTQYKTREGTRLHKAQDKTMIRTCLVLSCLLWLTHS